MAPAFAAAPPGKSSSKLKDLFKSKKGKASGASTPASASAEVRGEAGHVLCGPVLRTGGAGSGKGPCFCPRWRCSSASPALAPL
jgi:hypothetical protein